MNRFGTGLLVASCFGLVAALGVSAANADDQVEFKVAVVDAETGDAPPEGAPAATGEEKAAEEATDAEKAEAAAALEAAKAGEKEEVDGKWQLEDGTPTYNIVKDGDAVKQVDWYTYSGWRRYHAECHVCHGPNAGGSTFAPALADSLKTMTYAKFMQVVAGGQMRNIGGTPSVMPALGDNKNVMCYIDDIYVYIKARATGDMPAGRLSPDQRAEKPESAREYEKACLEN